VGVVVVSPDVDTATGNALALGVEALAVAVGTGTDAAGVWAAHANSAQVSAPKIARRIRFISNSSVRQPN
jgi:hypothetical protein